MICPQSGGYFPSTEDHETAEHLAAFPACNPGIAALVRSLKIGGTLEVPGGTITRHRQHVYSLAQTGNHVRTRWGTAAEIVQDAEQFIAPSELPQPAVWGGL